MYILHVSLGDPDSHQGGLNRYCKELMETQNKCGHKTAVIYPGTFIESKHPHIIHRGKNKYEILDALPVAITYGISEPKRYMVSASKNAYAKLLKKQRPDVIHIHSIQGIHLEFFEAAKELSIPMVMTTHDYYPICMKCILIDQSGKLCEGASAEKCANCNVNNGLSAMKQRIIQSMLYQSCKGSAFMRKAKARAKGVTTTTVATPLDIKNATNAAEYAELQNYYSHIVNMFSMIHCNSNLTYKIYCGSFPALPMRIVPITHMGLTRCQHKRGSICKITYMGGESAHKGYAVLMSAVKGLCENDSGQHWQLNLYGGNFQAHPVKDARILYHGYFGPEDAEQVWSNTDILVMPSQWRETFGFVLLEALCRGIPVICSDLVGAQDLNLPELIFSHMDAEQLYEKIVFLLNDDNYSRIQKQILKLTLPTDMEEHTKSMLALYQECRYEHGSMYKQTCK